MLLTVGCGVDGAGVEEAASVPSVNADVELEAQGVQDDGTLRLRAKVDFRGSIVRFYEPQDGVILVSETGRNGTSPAITAAMKNLDTVKLYEALSGKTAPDVLLQAAARAEAMALIKRPARAARPEVPETRPATFESTSTTSVNADVAQVKSAAKVIETSVDQWFFDEFCPGGAKDTIGGWQYPRVWMHSTGSGDVGDRNDVCWVTSTVSVIGGGSVHFKGDIRPWYSWSTWINVIIENGFWNQMHRVNNSTDFDVHARVSLADGDLYNWCTKISYSPIYIIGSN